MLLFALDNTVFLILYRVTFERNYIQTLSVCEGSEHSSYKQVSQVFPGFPVQSRGSHHDKEFYDAVLGDFHVLTSTEE